MNAPVPGAGFIETQFLLSAYRNGFFPMAEPTTGEIRWYSPDPRTILDLRTFNTPRSLRRFLRNHPFDVRIDTKFLEVVQACATREETWISDSIIASYYKLFELGFAHSVEAWTNENLVGGLYGVAIGGAFFGESMFSIIPQASKAALVALVDRLRARGFELIDTQFITTHLAMFGAIEISRKQYLERLKKALEADCSFVAVEANP
jgi:leucyl/phenylalanyl-tRNA--protein transferase